VVLKSYAKLNLYLSVLNKRRDNYHNIRTVFERISLFDRIILKSRPDKKIRIICSGPGVPKGRSNLCVRAAKLLQEKFAVSEGVDIKLIKRIPVGAGLGGGSSNAATVLLGLNKLWRLNLTKEVLCKLSSRIGCDVPFFVRQINFGQGLLRGDKIIPLRVPKALHLWHVLVVPKIHVSTPWVYKEWDKISLNEGRAGLTTGKSGVKILTSALRKKDLCLIEKSLSNELERVTLKAYPEVRRIKEKLLDLGFKATLMSGSGPAVFTIVSSRNEAVSLRRKLKTVSRSWRIFVARSL